MVNKKAKKSVSSKKTTAKKVVESTEEVVEKQPNITGYLVPVFVLREPVDKNIPVADIFYKKASDAITLQCHAPNQEAALEQIIEGDIRNQKDLDKAFSILVRGNKFTFIIPSHLDNKNNNNSVKS